MHRRRPNYRLVKIHRNYTTDEVARLFSIHRNTVRQWIKSGLPALSEKRPILILGANLAEFLRARRAKNKRPLEPDQMYCMRCRESKIPAGRMADYVEFMPGRGNLTGICPDCEAGMNRRVNQCGLLEAQLLLDIKIPLAPLHIGDRC